MAANPLTYRHNVLYFLLSLMALAGVQVFGLREYYGFSFFEISTDAAISWILLGLVIAGITNTLSFYHPERGKWLLVIFTPLAFAWIWLMISGKLILLINETAEYEDFFNLSRFYRFSMATLILTGSTGFSLLWYRLHARGDEERRREDMERMAREAELFKLRQQLQPHFLFNSLNSINSLIGSRPQEARNMVQQLSDFLRGTLRKEDQRFVSLREELESLELYLDIEQVRFGHRLKVKVECDEELREWKIPPLILQPVLENAIKFGLYGTTGDAEIKVRCVREKSLLRIVVTNPFDADSQSRSGTGFGLKSVKRRLYLLFGRTDLLELKNEEQIFTVVLKIPLIHESTDH